MLRQGIQIFVLGFFFGMEMAMKGIIMAIMKIIALITVLAIGYYCCLQTSVHLLQLHALKSLF